MQLSFTGIKLIGVCVETRNVFTLKKLNKRFSLQQSLKGEVRGGVGECGGREREREMSSVSDVKPKKGFSSMPPIGTFYKVFPVNVSVSTIGLLTPSLL